MPVASQIENLSQSLPIHCPLSSVDGHHFRLFARQPEIGVLIGRHRPRDVPAKDGRRTFAPGRAAHTLHQHDGPVSRAVLPVLRQRGAHCTRDARRLRSTLAQQRDATWRPTVVQHLAGAAAGHPTHRSGRATGLRRREQRGRHRRLQSVPVRRRLQTRIGRDRST